MLKKYNQLIFFLGLLASTTAIDALSTCELYYNGRFTKIGSGYYFIEHKLKKNWSDAYESCHRIGSELVTINNTEEWDAINNYLIDKNIMALYWTSGTDLAELGRHVWFANGERITQNIWAKGQPDNNLGLEHCDLMGFWPDPAEAPGLNDGRCEFLASYICEAPILNLE